MKQPHLFDRPEPSGPISPVDPNIREGDKPRAETASARILALLQRRPATNHELVRIGGTRFGARIHDINRTTLKPKGLEITCESKGGSLYLYSITESTK